MGKIDHVIASFMNQALAILPAKMIDIRAFLFDRTDDAKADQLKAASEQRAAEFVASIPDAIRRSDGVIMSGRVAVMPVFGILSQRVGMLERSSGGISTEEIGATLDSLVNDKQVKAIVMAFDSPGGSVAGVPELADKIRAARDQKRIVAVADSMAASAGYWLAAQASEVWVSPSGQVGSIGVITAHEDISVFEEKMGIKTTLVTSSPYKAEGSPYGPLTPEAQAELQSKVNQYHGMFIEALAKGRGVTENRVEKLFGQGRMMLADQAKAAGMVDRIGTLSEAVRRLGGEFNTSSMAAISRDAVAARARSLEISSQPS